MSFLPRFMLVKSNANGKFLCYGKDKLIKGGAPTTNLTFSHEINSQEGVAASDQLVVEPKRTAGAESSGPKEFHMIKFEVEEAKTAPGLVHIRTSYNNKYWVRKSVECNKIVAEAHKPEEDQSKWTCTLFKPILVGDAHGDGEANKGCVFDNHHGYGKPAQQIQLMHVNQLGQHYTSFDDESDQHLSLGINNNALTTFTVFDVEPTAILPEYMTLMGNDGKYLARYGDGGLFLGFVTSDLSGRGVAMSTTPQQTHPSYTCIMIKGTDIAWNLNPENKSVVLEHSRHAKASFAGVKDGDLYVSILCNINNNFLQRLSGTHGRSDGLQADTSTITEEAKLKVGEPVTAREILRATYDLQHSRVYDTITFDKYEESISNYTSLVQNEKFMVQYASENTMSWKQSLTVNVGIPVRWSSGIPMVTGGSDSSVVHVEYEPRVVTCEWGKEKVHTRKVATAMKVAIPPKKKVTLRVVATKSCCDVPFTCEVRDTMTDGTARVYTKTDGLFTGCNEYNIMHTTSMEDL